MRDIPRNDVYKPNNVDTGTDLNNNENGINPNFVKTPDDEVGLYNEEVNKTIVNQNLLERREFIQNPRVYRGQQNFRINP